MGSLDRKGWGSRVKGLILVAMVMMGSLDAHSEGRLKPLFIKARCDGKLASKVLSALKEAARASDEFDLIPNLDDRGRLDTVETIYLTCAENNDVTAVATQFGIAKCSSTELCKSVIDGLSLNVALCNANRSSDCGHAIFEAFEAHVKRPHHDQLEP
jgi:hypothetical protein